MEDINQVLYFQKKAHAPISWKDFIFTKRPYFVIISMPNISYFPT